MNTNPDGSLNFEPVTVEEAVASIETPAEHAKRMEELGKKFDLPKENINETGEIVFVDFNKDKLRKEVLTLKLDEYKRRAQEYKNFLSSKYRSPEDRTDLDSRLKEINYKINILDNFLLGGELGIIGYENQRRLQKFEEDDDKDFDVQLFNDSFNHIKKYATGDLNEVGLTDYIKIVNSTKEREEKVDSLEISDDGIENQRKIESTNNFDELFEVLDSFGEIVQGRSGDIRVSNLKQLIDKYRSGESPVYVRDILDDKENGGSDAIKSVTRTFGLRKKVYELLRKEGSGKYIKLDGSVK